MKYHKIDYLLYLDLDYVAVAFEIKGSYHGKNTSVEVTELHTNCFQSLNLSFIMKVSLTEF